MACLGKSAVLSGNPADAVYLGTAHRLCLRRCPPARHAARNVDPVGRLHSERDRNHSVLHLARSSPASLSKMRSGGGVLVPLLSCMRNSPGTDMSRVPSLRGAGLVALRTLRGTFAKG